MTAAERRKKYLVEKKFQMKPVYIIAGAFLLIILIIEWQIYSFLNTVLPFIALSDTKAEIMRFGILLMAQLFVIFLLITVLIVIHLHRFVGPLGRLSKEMEQMVDSNNYHLLTLRKKDTLKSLVESINKLIEKLMR